MEDFYAEESGMWKLYWAKTAGWLLQSYFSLGDGRVLSGSNSLVLIRRLLIDWFKIPFLKGPKL